MNQKVPTKIKARDIAIGFFGWLLVWNLIFYIFLPTYSSFGLMAELIIRLLAIIGIFLSFLYKRNWVGFGIITCIIINLFAWLAFWGGDILQLSVLPFPMGFALMAIN